MDMIEVYKFGGTSVGSSDRMLAVARLIQEQGPSGGRLVVVASAMSGVTDALVRACALVVEGQWRGAREELEAIGARHEEALVALATAEDPEPVRGALAEQLREVAEVLRASASLRELSPRARDKVLALGEKLSARLVAVACRRAGLDAVAMDADVFLETDDGHGEANPLPDVADRTIRAALLPALERGALPIVTGFCGIAPDGSTTTLGRGGSDLSATVVAAALGAVKVTLWSDVDGVFSANPKVVPGARVIRQLNFREAAEMSFYGAKVLHQRTMIPVTGLGIPVWSRNSMRPEAPGTVIDGRFTPGSHPVKAISAVGGHCLLSIEGKGMSGVPGVAARVFGALAARQISVTMISQSSSEASICLAIPEGDAERAEVALKREFRADLSRGQVEEIASRPGVGLVAAVGLGMANTPGVAARLMSALGEAGISILAIAQGSSELNISVAVDQRQADAAVRAIHEAFGLSRMDTGEDGAGALDLLLIGCGSVAEALVGLLDERRSFERFGLSARVVAVCDRSGFVLSPRGMEREALSGILAGKRSGRPVSSWAGASEGGPLEMVEAALGWRLSRPVLVDVSDADGVEAAFEAALRGGCDVVTANKKPLAGRLSSFEALLGAAEASGRLIKAEATVGAGLPIVDTLEMLLATGDRLRRAEGCFSGTLGFVMAGLEAGERFSAVVAEAARRGYTEPDPVADLSGVDVGRKAVILGRLSGLVRSDAPIELVGLVPLQWAGLGLAALIERLEGLDDDMAARVEAARSRGEVLRYVARVKPGRIEVGPRSVAAGSPAGMLQGTDNMVVFGSERYAARPLVITGPGAGVEVTAMGVLGDILRVAAERRL